MASTIILKNGTGSAVPSALAHGEPAINVTTGLFYYGSGSGGNAKVKTLSNFTNVTASGTVQAEQITSTDDAQIGDDLTVFGDITVDGEAKLDKTTIDTADGKFTASGANNIELTTTGTHDINLTSAGVPVTVPVNA